jgi:hypothetical protein
MATLERWKISFRYDRHGPTTTWLRGPGRVTKMAIDEKWPGVGARSGGSGKFHGQTMEWIKVTMEAPPGEDLDELLSTAEVWADAEFKKLHPKHGLNG